MHYCVTVAVPGVLTERQDVQTALDLAMSPHQDDEWDWFVVGGRWGRYWTLKPDAPDGPLGTEDPAIGGPPAHDDERQRTDCARLGDIEPESLITPYSWVNLEGEWHSKWLGPDGSGSQEVKDWEHPDDVHTKAYLSWIESLPQDTWLVNVDCHN